MRSVRKALEALAGDDLDDAAENVGGAAVVPLRARLAHQRHAGDQRGVLGVADLAAAQPRLLIQLLHQAVAGVIVGDARGVAQQVLYRHLPLERDEVELAVVLDADLLVGKFRDEFRDGIAEQEMAVLDQHHDADRDDRLGHREDPEDRVVRHRRAGRRALPAERLEPADLAAPRHQHGRTGQGALVDLALERIRHALQPGRGQTQRFRFGLGQGRGLRDGGGLGGGLRGHDFPILILLSGLAEVWRRTADLNRAGRGAGPDTVKRFALAIGAFPMLETARIGGDARFRRGVAQLVEYRSPKPVVAGSSPAAPAS